MIPIASILTLDNLFSMDIFSEKHKEILIKILILIALPVLFRLIMSLVSAMIELFTESGSIIISIITAGMMIYLLYLAFCFFGEKFQNSLIGNIIQQIWLEVQNWYQYWKEEVKSTLLLYAVIIVFHIVLLFLERTSFTSLIGGFTFLFILLSILVVIGGPIIPVAFEIGIIWLIVCVFALFSE